MRFFLIFVFTLSLAFIQAKEENIDYTIDKSGNVIISHIVEDLALNKDEIYKAGKKYLEESYKETKYKILFDSPKEGIIAGEGEYYEFYNGNQYLSAYFVNAIFTLRIDAKEGRARISISVTNYTGKRINQNKTANLCDKIVSFPPFSNADKATEEALEERPNTNDVVQDIGNAITANDSYSVIEGKKRVYKKAFPKLISRAESTLQELEHLLRSTHSIKADDDW